MGGVKGSSIHRWLPTSSLLHAEVLKCMYIMQVNASESIRERGKGSKSEGRTPPRTVPETGGGRRTQLPREPGGHPRPRDSHSLSRCHYLDVSSEDFRICIRIPYIKTRIPNEESQGSGGDSRRGNSGRWLPPQFSGCLGVTP